MDQATTCSKHSFCEWRETTMKIIGSSMIGGGRWEIYVYWKWNFWQEKRFYALTRDSC